MHGQAENRITGECIKLNVILFMYNVISYFNIAFVLGLSLELLASSSGSWPQLWACSTSLMMLCYSSCVVFRVKLSAAAVIHVVH